MDQRFRHGIGCAFGLTTGLAVGWAIAILLAATVAFSMYASPDLVTRDRIIPIFIVAFRPLATVLVAWFVFAVAVRYWPRNSPGRWFRYSSPQVRLRSWQIFLIIALCVAALPFEVYYYKWTTDSTPVELQMHDGSQIVRFSIPKAYLPLPGDQKGGLTTSFSMDVIYPAMVPLSGTGKSRSDPDALTIRLRSHFRTGAHWSTGGSIDFMLARYWTWVERIGTEFDVYVYHRDRSLWNDKSSLVEEYLVPTDRRPDREIYFSCFRYLRNPAVGCTGTATFGSEIEMNWIFRRSRFEEWPEMLSKADDFLKSFVKR